MMKKNANDFDKGGVYYAVPVNNMTALTCGKNVKVITVEIEKKTANFISLKNINGRFTISEFRSTNQYLRISCNVKAFNLFIDKKSALDYIERKSMTTQINDKLSACSREHFLAQISRNDLMKLHKIISKY
ncbi:hypothetical protein [Photobacterium leiognathi]|uniref:hypothetical protein n=1 Tax=Photobacterium leiognathi TaxID=553611 RepID=UPI00273903BD|nr:hypothetical protein [Photobacterium leiognathi]